MHNNTRRTLGASAVLIGLALFAGACGDDSGSTSTSPTAAPGGTTAGGTATTAAPNTYADLKGSIRIDGSSTVAPLTKVAAEDFQDATKGGVRVTVGISGTGGGFEKFCNGETDISDASRPIKESEADKCKAKGIDYVGLPIANDGLAVVVSTRNSFVECLTVDQLKAIWAPDSKVSNWKDVDPSFPDKRLTLFGPGPDSGTFDYFTEAVNGKSGASRTDYQPSEDDNVLVTGISGDDGALGYFGLSYVEENKGKIKAVEIDGGKGCVEADTKTVQDGSYSPLGRPIYIYVAKSAWVRPEVKGFVGYFVENLDEITREALFVPLTAAQKSGIATELTKLG